MRQRSDTPKDPTNIRPPLQPGDGPYSLPDGSAIARLRPADRSEAIGLLAYATGITSQVRAEQFLTYAEQTGMSLEHLWGRYGPDGLLVDVVLLLPQVGRTGLVFMSRAKKKDVHGMAQLVDVAVGHVPPSQVTLSQALLSPGEGLQRSALEMAGFDVLTTLCYMQLRVTPRAPRPTPPDNVTLSCWAEDRREQFMAMLDASYEDTQDCPKLRGLRDTRDVLAGHMATGRFEPSLWTLVRVDDEPAGVMLLNPVPAAACVELVYLGLAAKFRGRKIGALLLRHGMWQCGQRGQPYLTLAVDEHNAPAMKLYRRFGFSRTSKKLAMIRSVRDLGATNAI